MPFPMSLSTRKGGDTLASSADAPVKVRKPYTITKQRERWTEDEHQKFLDALKLHGRAWRRIEEHIGTKTAVQIRSHAQKFFSKLEREASLSGSLATAGSGEIEIPPPRPKRKPSRPYPKKALGALSNSPSFEEDSKSPPAVYSAFTPLETSYETTKPSLLPKKAGSSTASLRLFGQTMIQGMDKVDADNELLESTGSPRSQVSIGTEETSALSPVVSNTASDTWNQSTLLSKVNEPAILDTKSHLFDALSEWEKSLLAAHAPHVIGLVHPIPEFWQGFVPPSFAHGINDDTSTAAAIAAVTYAVASAWQAVHGALISNSIADSNASIVYSPTAILAATGKPISVSTPRSPFHEQPTQEQQGPYHECGNDSEGTPSHLEESTAECCSSLTDSSRPCSYDRNDERVPAKKRQRMFFGDGMPLYNKPPESLQIMKCESPMKLDGEDLDNVSKNIGNSAMCSRSPEGCSNGFSENNNAGHCLLDELMQPVEKYQQTSILDTEQPLSLILEACGLNSVSETDEGSGILKDEEMVMSSLACDEVSKSSISTQCLEGLSNKELKDGHGLQFGVNGTYTESGEHLFMFKTGEACSRYSGIGFVPYKKPITNDFPSKHED